MKFARIMLPLVCSAPILLGCTTPAVAPGAAASKMTVQPVLRIRDAAGSARDFYQLGRFYQGQNRLEQAADAYRKALEYRKDDLETRNALATTYSAQGKLEQAVAEFEAILQSQPQLAHVQNNLGYTRYLQGNLDQAIIAFNAAIALEPQNARAYNNLGLAYRKLGEMEKARLAFGRAADLYNGNAVAQAAPAAAENIADAAPSVALQGDARSISVTLQPVGAGTVALAGASPARTLPTVGAQAQLAAGAITLDLKDAPSMAAGTGAVPVDGLLAATGGAVASKPFRLEIANGNGVTGLARRVGAHLVQRGLPSAHLINLKPYREPASSIRYRQGFQAEALRLSQSMDTPPAALGNQRLPHGVDVQLVLGKDALTPVALFGAKPDSTGLARKTAPRGQAG